jgi:hypothetical protein
MGKNDVGAGPGAGIVTTPGVQGTGAGSQFMGQFFWPTAATLAANGLNIKSNDPNTKTFLATYAGQPMLGVTGSTAYGQQIAAIKSKFPNVFAAIQSLTMNPAEGPKIPGWYAYMNHVYVQTRDVNNGRLDKIDPSIIPGSGVTPKTPVTNTYGQGLSSATASQQVNAFDNLQTQLTSWGLKADINDIKTLIFKQGDHLINTGVLTDIIRGTVKTGDAKMDAKFKANYDAAFPGLNEHNASLGIGSEKMTEAQYQQYVQTVQGIAQQYGLPQGFINKQEIAQLIKGNVSASEFSDRVVHLYTAANNADPATKQMLQQYYGLSTGDLAAHFADPKKAYPLLERQLTASALGGYANNVGLQGITQAQAEELANRVNQGGVSSSGATMNAQSMGSMQQSLLAASRDVALTRSAPGANEPTVNTTQLIGAQVGGFAGTNQVAEQTQVARAEQAKAAPFEKGGGYVENAKGVVGIGSART